MRIKGRIKQVAQSITPPFKAESKGKKVLGFSPTSIRLLMTEKMNSTFNNF